MKMQAYRVNPKQAKTLCGMVVALMPFLFIPIEMTAAPTVVNGGFEADVVTGAVSVAGGGLTGWTVGGTSGYPVLVHEAPFVNVPYGEQLILLGDPNNGLGHIEQTISGFTPGQSYLLAFAIATRDSGCGGGADFRRFKYLSRTDLRRRRPILRQGRPEALQSISLGRSTRYHSWPLERT